MPEHSEAGLLTLARWLSPAFPVSAYAYSHGLEWAIAAGDVRGAADLRNWVADVLWFGTGRSDAILLAHALASDADLAELSDLALALSASAERARETREQGAAFARVAGALAGHDLPELPYPVAFGAAARGLGLPTETILAHFLQAFAANLVAAAVRFVPLGQSDGQQVLADLAPEILRLAAEAATAPLDAIGTAAIRADLAAMQHETMSPRIFRT